MSSRVISFLSRETSRYLYFILIRASHQKILRLMIPRYTRGFIRKIIISPIVGSYEKKRILQRVDADTILLADYPRCGVNWLRMIFATVLNYRESGEFRKITHEEMLNYCPSIHGHETYRPYHFNGGISFLKTHSHYYPEFKRAIMIYRESYEAIKSIFTLEKYNLDKLAQVHRPDLRGNDQRNIALSGKKIEGLSAEESFLLHWSKEYISHHETWLQAVQARPEHFLVIKYEDMVDNCEGLLPEIILFSGLQSSNLNEKKISMLSSMYTRSSSNWQTSADLEFRNRKFNELSSIICPSELKRLDSNLEHRIRKMHHQLDALRLKLPS